MIALAFNTAQAQYTASAEIPSANKGWAANSMTMKYYTAGDDTASGADVIRMGAILNMNYDVVIKVVMTRVSGTIGAGSVLYARGSADGVNWVTLSEGETKAYRDTNTVANAASGTYVFQFDAVGFKYVEVYYDQSTGTSPIVAPVATIYYRRHNE